ncbi:hypothetical protein Kpol_1076p9 [Vanderwaltozyma polyspora DSM 70294]|uniref:Transcription activator GCR1-like domain-containing protein n=1 Tax=Vanderwaltozyma polyspora (strain ATCC 22028 / DSM 70294 / BCRC 21397 / CBS 2163 / NBRC 10782 / NRRL Y-8283 / UCD 57-17) TaxID=436907 RepID=A7TSG0_VANPO|nr:uncharacterized protein Kpol_1076p9 [Vanderwaltozyma polyspora DSM 70294]EDO14803.1 hypothetical protein Kpol_1076p9 [Vanderwaltozyma polyspora DSM 70294]
MSDDTQLDKRVSDLERQISMFEKMLLTLSGALDQHFKKYDLVISTQQQQIVDLNAVISTLLNDQFRHTEITREKLSSTLHGISATSISVANTINTEHRVPSYSSMKNVSNQNSISISKPNNESINNSNPDQRTNLHILQSLPTRTTTARTTTISSSSSSSTVPTTGLNTTAPTTITSSNGTANNDSSMSENAVTDLTQATQLMNTSSLVGPNQTNTSSTDAINASHHDLNDNRINVNSILQQSESTGSLPIHIGRQDNKNSSIAPQFTDNHDNDIHFTDVSNSVLGNSSSTVKNGTNTTSTTLSSSIVQGNPTIVPSVDASSLAKSISSTSTNSPSVTKDGLAMLQLGKNDSGNNTGNNNNDETRNEGISDTNENQDDNEISGTGTPNNEDDDIFKSKSGRKKKKNVYVGDFQFLKSPHSVMDLWKEYTEGINGQPSIRELESIYQTGWRRDPAVNKRFSRRKVLYKAIETGLNRGYSLDYIIKILEDYRYVDRNKNQKRPIGWIFHSANIPDILR